MYLDLAGKSARFTVLDYACLIALVYVVSKLFERIRRGVNTTKLRGPASKSFMWGNHADLLAGEASDILEGWAQEFGNVFRIHTAFGSKKIILTDPKAVSHFYSKETFTYVNSSFTKAAIEGIVGRGVLWAEGESHRRQRRTLNPAFSNQAIRAITPVFYDSAYKVKNAWDTLVDSSSGISVIDVHAWMNRVSLDTVGIAGFAHDFGSLDGRQSDVADVFEEFGKPSAKPRGWVFIFAPVLPILMKLPSSRKRIVAKLHNSMAAVADDLLKRTRKETVGNGAKSEKSHSIIGAVVKAETSETELRLTEDEALAQMKTLILAGYETTSVSLTWALIELSREQGRQDKLRDELSSFGSADPTWDQLTNSLPYLDAVVRECLRLHPPLPETNRIASEDDIVPLAHPLTTASGAVVDRIHIARGTAVGVPIRTMNRSTDIWGPDAKDFVPERWLHPDEDGMEGGQGLPKRAVDIQGWRHILTFIDGPRTCLGRGFAIAEFKAVLSVLIRNYKFELRDGPETKIETVRAILPRPKVAGEEGYSVPLCVTRIE